MATNTLTERAMLATVRFTGWSASKADDTVRDAIAAEHGSDPAFGRYTKKLIDRDAIKPVRNVVLAARQYHRKHTMPWTDEGTRILPAAAYFGYMEAMRKFKEDHARAADAFAEAYAGHVQAARERLGSLFNEGDYPAEGSVRALFTMDTVVSPLPSARDFRVSLGDDEVEAVQRDIDRRTKEAVENAHRDTWTRIHDVVARLAQQVRDHDPEKDGGPAPRIYASAFDAVREMADIMGALNITDDPAMDRIRDDILSGLCVHSVDDVRGSETARVAVRDNAAAVLDAMAGYIGEPAQRAA